MLRQVTGSVYIKAPKRLVYGVLTRYGSYRRWIPDVTESRVLASEGEVTVAELRSPPLSEGKLILEFVESPQSWLLFQQVDRYRVDGLSGRYDLEEADGGTSVVVDATMSLRTGLLELGRRRKLQTVLDRTLTALKQQALSLAAQGLTNEEGERTKVLEIERTGNALEVSLNGEVFRLTSQSEGEAR